MPAAIVWFRQDLRLADNPALHAAAESGGPVIPVYVWAPEEEGDWAPGSASRWWLHHSLRRLDKSLRGLGSRLIVGEGSSLGVLQSLAAEAKAEAVFWNRRCEPDARRRDAETEAVLRREGVAVRTFDTATLLEPGAILNRQGRPFQVFTPFYRACLAAGEPAEPLAAPTRLRRARAWPASLPLEDLALLPKVNWTRGIEATWTPGEEAALDAVGRFLDGPWVEYARHRDRPDLVGTSRLSPYLRWGEISPRQVWHAVRQRVKRSRRTAAGRCAESYVRQLFWREFAYHLLYHFPATMDKPLRAEFSRFPWRADGKRLGAWQSGRTGYPLVDAGMRELWHTGWMHNRVRMVVGSFLVKHLLLPWQEGARWFWDTLVDADLANNTLGWQWCAGCGADAAPYFRVFNPVLQGAKFDPAGEYVRRWVPELKELPPPAVHRPRQAGGDGPGGALGEAYPRPIVDGAEGRKLALAAYEQMKRLNRQR